MLVILSTVSFSISFILTPLIVFYSIKISDFFIERYRLNGDEFTNRWGIIVVKKIPLEIRTEKNIDGILLKRINFYNSLIVMWTFCLTLGVLLFFLNILVQ